MSLKSKVVCWRVERWPTRDRETWDTNVKPISPFRKAAYRGTRNPRSIEGIEKSCGRWLSFLDSQGWLDPEAPPLERVTPDRIWAYIEEMQQVGNRSWTIIGRLRHLRLAMAILAPGQNASCITHPDGISIYASLPKTKRTLVVPDTGVMYHWAIDMMDVSNSASSPLVYRDGLILAMLAARARRLRSMVLLRVGHEFFKDGEHYRVHLQIGQSKTPRVDRFNMPEHLTPYIDHYLAIVRPTLLGSRSHDAVWVGRDGGPLSEKAFQHMVHDRTHTRFGTGFGPHRARHGITTTLALRDPGNPGIAADVLGISGQVLQQHYDRAGQSQAAATYAELIAQKRRDQLRPQR